MWGQSRSLSPLSDAYFAPRIIILTLPVVPFLHAQGRPHGDCY